MKQIETFLTIIYNMIHIKIRYLLEVRKFPPFQSHNKPI